MPDYTHKLKNNKSDTQLDPACLANILFQTFCFKRLLQRCHHPHHYCPLAILQITQAPPHPKMLALPLKSILAPVRDMQI